MPPAAAVLRSHLELAPLPTAPGCARGHVRAVLLEWDLPDLSDTAELVTSELVTNAILASPRGSPVELQVTREAEGSVLISVWDASSEMPVLEDASPDDESGRGLMLVVCLASGWGAYYASPAGKVIWARISRDRTAAPDAATARPARRTQ
jgi:anti-sigma regulatory factor (Ser/Thr protein kinase)